MQQKNVDPIDEKHQRIELEDKIEEDSRSLKTGIVSSTKQAQENPELLIYVFLFCGLTILRSDRTPTSVSDGAVKFLSSVPGL